MTRHCWTSLCWSCCFSYSFACCHTGLVSCITTTKHFVCVFACVRTPSAKSNQSQAQGHIRNGNILIYSHIHACTLPSRCRRNCPMHHLQSVVKMSLIFLIKANISTLFSNISCHRLLCRILKWSLLLQWQAGAGTLRKCQTLVYLRI